MIAPDFRFDAVIPCRSGCKLGHLFEVEVARGDESALDLGRIVLVKGARRREVEYLKLPVLMRDELYFQACDEFERFAADQRYGNEENF